jgi:hypothetical protein
MKLLKYFENFFESTIDEFGWEEISSSDFYEYTSSVNFQEFSETELKILNDFAMNHKLELSDTWNYKSSIKIYKENKFEITIVKRFEEYFYIRVTHTEPFLYRPSDNFMAEQRDGLTNLLNNISKLI